MNQRSARMIGAGILVFDLAVLGGAVVERIRYEPRRAAMLEDMKRTIRAYEAQLTASERDELAEAPRLGQALQSPRKPHP